MARTRPIAGERARARLAGSTSAVLDPPVAEPDEAPTAPTKPPRVPRVRGRSSGSHAWLAGLLALAVAAVAAFGLVAYRVHNESQVEAARTQALAAAQREAVTVLSYD
jgi:uncharacterized protein HemX